jgi:hypothetical protein
MKKTFKLTLIFLLLLYSIAYASNHSVLTCSRCSRLMTGDMFHPSEFLITVEFFLCQNPGLADITDWYGLLQNFALSEEQLYLLKAWTTLHQINPAETLLHIHRKDIPF